jgi:GNAT superfamily N-acetyltransferase
MRGVFRWGARPTPGPDEGVWLPVIDPRVPPWLHPFGGEVLVALDGGHYVAGVGIKRHDRYGHELAVVTHERARGRGLARRLVAQAARRVIADGAVPTYLHDPRNTASARVADAAGFPDRGWQVIGFFSSPPG